MNLNYYEMSNGQKQFLIFFSCSYYIMQTGLYSDTFFSNTCLAEHAFRGGGLFVLFILNYLLNLNLYYWNFSTFPFIYSGTYNKISNLLEKNQLLIVVSMLESRCSISQLLITETDFILQIPICLYLCLHRNFRGLQLCQLRHEPNSVQKNDKNLNVSIKN